MRRGVVVFGALLLSANLLAQIKGGNIWGKVTDNERNPLPGVSVTLNGPEMAALTAVTNESGIYRFPSIPPGTRYVVKAELPGFTSVVEPTVAVTIGASTEINLTMEAGKLEEEITVTAASPVVDPKRTAPAWNVNKDELQSLPTARDPWVVLQMAPAVMLDRENVGGSESGQQSLFVARGDMSNNGYVGSDNLWMLDGIDITDPAALGGSSFYYDFDTFEEMNVQSGGAADVTIQTGGIVLNMVTRRGGNKTSLAGRFYLTDNFFQSDNLTPELRAQGVLNTNEIRQIKDYGVNAGGPVFKDRLWWWASYGIQDIFIYNILGKPDTTLLNNYGFKLNAQLLSNNRLEVFIKSGDKEKLGWNASVAKPEGNHMTGKYHWGSPLLLLQDEHVFNNNLYLSLKCSLSDAGFGYRPMVDEGLVHPEVYDNTLKKYVAYGYGITQASWEWFTSNRPRRNFQLNASYFNDTFLGLSHEVKIGAEYSHKVGESASGEPDSFNIYRNYTSPVMDADHDGARTAAEMAGWQRITWHRDHGAHSISDQFAAYIQDTITKGRFTFTLGLRFDKQVPSLGRTAYNSNHAGNQAWDTVFTPAASNAMLSILPPVTAEPVKGVSQILGPNNSSTGGPSHAYEWNTWSPRIGITWDITGNGKTLLKLALSQYGDVMGVGWFASYPIGTGGYGRFWWMDGGWGLVNGAYQRLSTPDGKATLDELFWYNRSGAPDPLMPYRVFDDAGDMDSAVLADLDANGYNSQPYLAGMLADYDWNNKTALDYTSGIIYWVDQKSTQSSTWTREILLSLEREIFPNFSASVSGILRRYDNFDYYMTYYPADRGYDGVIDPAIFDADGNPAGLDLTNLIIDPQHPPAQGRWYVEAGKIPASFTIDYPTDGSVPWGGSGTVTYSTEDAAGRPFYLPASYYPVTGTPYSVVRKGNNYDTYMGLDLVLTKRLSNRWFMNASFTWQNQMSYWGSDFLDPTNMWVFDDASYGTWGGGPVGKVSVLMYTSWMAKLSGLWQLPYGFTVSATVNAREGWKIPHSFYMEIDPYAAPNPYYYSTMITTQKDITDSLPSLVNVSIKFEKRISVGSGRLYLMADVFNLFNSATVNRAYDAYMGDTYWSDAGITEVANFYNATYRRYNEILNPRIWRFGARFEF